MFKKQDRFSFRSGVPKEKLVTPLFILKFQKSTDPKYAVVVGKRVSKKAVQRNKAKRLFTQALQEILKEKTNNNDLVFFLRLPYTEYQKSAIISELENLISKLNANTKD
jgi:ribonuclease P protein component